MTLNRVIHRLRQQYPGLSKRADTGSRQAAIRLFCLECMGGNSAEVKKCCARECPLWSYREGKKPENLSACGRAQENREDVFEGLSSSSESQGVDPAEIAESAQEVADDNR